MMPSKETLQKRQCSAEVTSSTDSSAAAQSKDNLDCSGVCELLDPTLFSGFPDSSIFFDPVVIHTLSLLKYHKNMLHTRDDRHVEAVPEQNGQKPKLLSLPLNHINMTEDYVLEVVSKSVMLLSAHIGFEGIENSVISMLSLAVAKYLQKVWNIMNICDRRRKSGRNSAFACSFLQVLRILRIEDVKDIAEFYRRRVLLRRDSLHSLCVKNYKKKMDEKLERKHELLDAEKQSNAKPISSKRRKILE